MAQSREDIYTNLAAGMLIGPEHHQFELRGEPVECPLGQLWQADDISTHTPLDASLIMLDPFLLKHKNFLANFKKQIVRSKAIQHPHIAEIYGYFIHKGGLLFFAFEPVEGLTLEQLTITSAKNRLQLKQIQGLLTQLTAAMNICSRHWRAPFGAIESQFVFVNKKGGVKLLPLSMREFFHYSKEMPSKVFSYKKSCSPQALDNPELDSSSDSYAVAAIATHLLGGARLSLDDTAESRQAIELERPTDISDDQWQCLEKALAPAPSERYKNPADFVKQFFSQSADPAPAEADAEPATLDELPTKKAGLFNSFASRQVSLKLGKKHLNFAVPAIATPILIFLLGLASGFILGVISSADKIDSTNKKLEQWRNEAIQQRSIIDNQQQEIEKTLLEVKDLEIKNTALKQQTNSANKSQAVPLSVFRDPLPDNQYGPDMVVLAAGSFFMGDSTGDGNDNELPVHQVTFKHSFALARYEVSFAQYDFFATQTGRALPDDEGWGRGNQPVINVSWRDARAYTLWLAKQTELPYRLPSEAEWEYIARAGTETNYWWGNKNVPGYAHCTDCGDPLGGKQPLPIGSMKANPWGFHDLNGNVDEWVSDCYSNDYTRAKKDGSSYQLAGCQNRSMRGGSWFDIDRVTRSSSRYRHPPNAKRNTWGFRVALDLNS
ncbi:SUMF1/EgtB/PvdO family nonheme iron enzyme [Gammaproteobacteria bacterium AS21]|jgi:formylglycine-generating enzyme required for sulfatase activity